MLAPEARFCGVSNSPRKLTALLFVPGLVRAPMLSHRLGAANGSVSPAEDVESPLIALDLMLVSIAKLPVALLFGVVPGVLVTPASCRKPSTLLAGGLKTDGCSGAISLDLIR